MIGIRPGSRILREDSMVAFPFPAPPQRADEALRQIAQMTFCVEVLRERSGDGLRGWLWDIKRKVAEHCLHLLERRLSSEHATTVPGLSEEDQRRLLLTHPLLIDVHWPSTPQSPAPEWLAGLREKVTEYVRRLQQHGNE
jgi:hypothetical protein